MSAALNILKGLCLVVLALALWEIRGLVRDIRVSLRETDIVLANINEAAHNAADASGTAAEAAEQQKQYWAKTSLETYKTMASLRLTITRVDHDIIPRFSALLDSTNALTRQSAAELDDTTQRLQPTLANLESASAGAAEVMSNPAIGVTFEHLAETSASVADTSKQVDLTATDIRAYVHRLTQPARSIYGIFKEFLGLAYQLRGAL